MTNISSDICLTPEKMEISATEYSALKQVCIVCPDTAEASEWAGHHLQQWYGAFAPDVKVKKLRGTCIAPGAYNLDISGGEVKVCAGDLAGVRHALYSLRQITIPARGTRTVQGWIVPETSVEDRPALGFRGLHLCWFAETEAVDIERKIRLAAYYKFNYVVIESWGTFRSEKNPWLGWPDGKMTRIQDSTMSRWTPM